MRSLSSLCLASVSLVAAAALTSCSSTQMGTTQTVHLSLQGRAMGGEQPITASTIQLYAVGTTTDGGASNALINQALTPVTTSDGTGLANSNANAGNNNNQFSAGSFTITGDYTCPSASTLVYIAAIGGNPGAGTNNAQEQIAALGPCGNLNANTFVIINEVTTVGTVRALSSYMTAYDHVGSTPAHAAALATAFSTVNDYVSTQYGSAPGASLPAGYDAASNDLRALANVVQYCVNSTGGSPCTTFFGDAQGTAATTPTDTVTALLDIFADPTNKVSTIFNLQPTTPAFAPTNAAAPSDWTLPIVAVPSTPTFSPNGGTFGSAPSVTISVANADGNTAIYYTTDGTTPSATNGTLYSSSVSIAYSETLKAIGIESGRVSGSVGTSSPFTITGLTTPSVSLSAISVTYNYTTPNTLTATSNVNGSVVTFATAGGVGGTITPTHCTIASGSCSVTYNGSGTLQPGTYNNDLTASFSGYGAYNSATASSTLTITTPTNLGNQTGLVAVGTTRLFDGEVIFTTAGTLGSISVNTQGATNLDFTADSPQPGTCTIGTAYAAGNVCTVYYDFTPLYAGLRVGAIVLRDSSNNVLGTTLLSGQGQAPQAVVYPGVESIIFNSFGSDVFGEAIDASNNLYVGQGASIYKYPYNSTTQTWSTSYTTVMTGPQNGGIGQFGIDGAGNVYLGNGGEVLKATLNPSGTYTTSVIYSGGTSYSSNVDPLGNVFEGDGSTLTKLAPTTTGTYTSSTVSGTSFGGLNGLVADYGQNLYLCDSSNSALYKLTYNSGSYTQSTIATGMSNCNGVATDASGTVYAVDDGTSSHVQRFGTSNSGSTYSLLGTAGSFNRENGVLLDGPGNLYVTDDGSGDYLDHVVLANAYTFPYATQVHNSGSAFQAFVLTNIGNMNMTYTSAILSGDTTDFTITSNGCSSTVSTNSNACSVTVKFAPTTTGSKSATLTFTDNSGGVSGTTQVITLTGTGS